MIRTRVFNRLKMRFTPAQTRKLLKVIAESVIAGNGLTMSSQWIDQIKDEYIDNARSNAQAIYRIQGLNLQQHRDEDIENTFYGLDECLIITDDHKIREAGSIKDMLNGVNTAMKFKVLIDSLEEDINIIKILSTAIFDIRAGDLEDLSADIVEYMELPVDLLRFGFFRIMSHIWSGKAKWEPDDIEQITSNVYLPAHTYDPLSGPSLERTDQKIKVYYKYAAELDDPAAKLGTELYNFYSSMTRIWGKFDDIYYMERMLEEVEDLAINMLAMVVATVLKEREALPLDDYIIEIDSDVGIIDVSPSALFRANLALDLPILLKDED